LEQAIRLVVSTAPEKLVTPALEPFGLGSGGALKALRRLGGLGRQMYLTAEGSRSFALLLPRLLEACRRSPRVKQLVLASSDKAYGDQDTLPYFEAAPLQGRHPYEVSKSCADLIAQAYYTTYRLPVGITRCGNIYGGGDLNWDRIVPGTMRSVLRGEAPVIRSDGTLLRDYLYVADIVEGYLRLAECLEDPALHGQAFNFGMDDPKTVLEVAQAIIAISDYPDLKPVVLNQASHEIAKQYLASEKAHRLLGWRAQYSLAEGLRRTLAWYREFFQK
jgi:CDP-glucose 4,6-dehydratase